MIYILCHKNFNEILKALRKHCDYIILCTGTRKLPSLLHKTAYCAVRGAVICIVRSSSYRLQSVAVWTKNTFAYIRYISRWSCTSGLNRFCIQSVILLYSNLTIVSVRSKSERRAVNNVLWVQCEWGYFYCHRNTRILYILFVRKFASDLFFSHSMGHNGRHPSSPLPVREYLS